MFETFLKSSGLNPVACALLFAHFRQARCPRNASVRAHGHPAAALAADGGLTAKDTAAAYAAAGRFFQANGG